MDIFTCYPVYRFINQEGFEISVILCGVYPYNNNEGLGSPFGMNRIGGITMQQKKESNHTEVISIEEYTLRREKDSGIWIKARDGEEFRRRTMRWS